MSEFSYEDSEATITTDKVQDENKATCDDDKNRIAQMCYGTDGLLDFLDLMFMQFEHKRQVRMKFNYYFAIRKQIRAIESQIQEEIEKSAPS